MQTLDRDWGEGLRNLTTVDAAMNSPSENWTRNSTSVLFKSFPSSSVIYREISCLASTLERSRRHATGLVDGCIKKRKEFDYIGCRIIGVALI